MNKLINFLKGQIAGSIERLVRSVAEEIRNTTRAKVGNVLGIKAAAAISVMKGMKMTEELYYFLILLTSLLGEKGLMVPAEISKMVSPVVDQAKTIVAATATAPPPAPKPTLVPATKPPAQEKKATAPARELKGSDEPKPFNPQNGYRTWVGFLNGVIRESNVPWPTLQGLTAKLVEVNVQFTDDDFSLLFSAMKVANTRGQHIVGNKANPAKLFAMAPVTALDDLLFGQDGLLLAVTNEVAKQNGDLPNWLCAKCSIVLDAIEVADTDNRLGEQEATLVDKFLGAMDEKNPPRWLAEKGQEVWLASGTAKQNGNGAHASNPVLAEKLSMALAN